MAMQMEEGGLLSKSLSNGSVVERVIDRITQAIIEGELKPGDRLPTEFELAKSLQVGRNSIREAIKVLNHFGVVQIVRADGTFVSDSFHERMLDPLLYGLILQKDKAEDIMELRQVFDIGIINVVIERGGSALLDPVEQALGELEDSLSTSDAALVLEKDLAFHTAINASIGNVLVSKVASYIDRITIPSRKRTMESIFERNLTDEFLLLHRHIVEIIRDRRVDEVGPTVIEHYRYWRQKGE